jgi:hypothetical protein
MRCKRRSSGLETFLSESPHLASHVKYLFITLDSVDSSPGAVVFMLATRILGLLPNLEHITLLSQASVAWEPQPAFFKAAFRDALGLSNLRSLYLNACTFTNAIVLDSLLSHAPGLKELSIWNVRFSERVTQRVERASPQSPIVLESLRVCDRKFSPSYLDEIISTFTFIDIAHLRFLDVGVYV